jgi:hypothetical protein
MKKKKAGLGCLFWLALALLVLVVFLYNRERINRVLAASGLIPRGGKPGVTVRTEPPADPRPAPATPAEPAPPPPAPPPPASPEVVIRVPSATPAPETSGTTRTRKARLFFVQVSPSGDITLRGVIRDVPYTDSPLRETLLALLDGQAARELTDGVLTMIPAGVKLLNVYVRDQVAYVDLSDQFRFNALGRAGLVAQIKQLVYTATEFPTVRSVQMLIEGKRLDYLSSEGPRISDPISRDRLIKGLP